MTLKTKIMIILVVTVILSLGGSGWIFLNHFEKTFKTRVFQTVDSIAKNNAHSIDNYLRDHQAMLAHFGSDFPRNEIHDTAKLDTYLKNLYQQFPIFDNGFFYLNNSGVLLSDYPTQVDLRGENFSFRDYFHRTMESQRGIIAQPYRSKRSGKPVLTFTAHIKAADGSSLGLLGGSVLLGSDSDLARRIQKTVGETGYSYVFDETRMLILHPEAGRILKRDVPPGVNKAFDAAIIGYYGPIETINSKGVAMLSSFQPVPGTDWIVASQKPISEALSPLQEGKKPLLFSAVFGSLIAALVGMGLVHRNMRGLMQLENLTRNLQIPDTSKPEIESAIDNEVVKFAGIQKHTEFGKLANIINLLYVQLAEALINKNNLANKLESAYEKLKHSQSQILQQEKMASIGQLAAGVAHEINNPIGFISSNISTLSRHHERMDQYRMALEKALNEHVDERICLDIANQRKTLKIDAILEDVDELIEECEEGTERIRKIVRDLGAFSRVDQPELCPVDLNECLESTLAIAWNEIKYKAKVEKSYGDVPLLRCYPQQLNQVFLNLLINATHAIERDGIIRIETLECDEKIIVRISDNGAGISEEHLNHIFEPFFTTKEVGKGTGLGLSISYDIICKHKGTIDVESTPSKGTTFKIELPLKDSEGENQ